MNICALYLKQQTLKVVQIQSFHSLALAASVSAPPCVWVHALQLFLFKAVNLFFTIMLFYFHLFSRSWSIWMQSKCETAVVAQTCLGRVTCKLTGRLTAALLLYPGDSEIYGFCPLGTSCKRSSEKREESWRL